MGAKAQAGLSIHVCNFAVDGPADWTDMLSFIRVAELTLLRFGDEAPRPVPVEQKTGHAHDLYREIEAFVRAVQGEPSVLTGLEGRRAVYMCQAAAESLQQGQAVSLDDWK